jgi:hypothetical protein
MIRIVWVASMLGLAAGCKPSCEQPIEAFCQEYTCRSLDSYLAATEVWDGGTCPNFSRATCGDLQVVFGGTYVATAQFFASDGGLVAASQTSDIATDCGEYTRTWGTVPDCTLENATRYCANR